MYTFTASRNRPLPLSPRRGARLLRCFLDIRNVRIVEVQCERSGHRYSEASGDHHRWRSSSRVRWILARSTIHAVTSTFFFSTTSWPLGPPRSWPYVSAYAGCLMETLFSCPHLKHERIQFYFTERISFHRGCNGVICASVFCLKRVVHLGNGDWEIVNLFSPALPAQWLYNFSLFYCNLKFFFL